MREIAQLANSLPDEQREDLRAYVIALLREEIEEADATSAGAVGRAGGKFNPLGIGIPVFLMGGLLMIVFPPVGLLLLAVAATLVVWGLIAALVGGRVTRKG